MRDIDRKDSLRRCSLFILKVTEMFFEVKIFRQTNQNRFLSMNGAMLRAEEFPASGVQRGKFRFRHGEPDESGPEVIHGLVGRVDHVGGIETVVPQLVKHDLVGWKIFTTLRELRQNLVQSKQKGAFADLVAMRPVLEVADGRDGEHEFLLRMPRDHIHEQCRCLADGEASAGELLRVDFQAVGNGLTGAEIFIDPCRAEGYDDFGGCFPPERGFLQRCIGDLQELVLGAAGEGCVVAERADEAGTGAHLDALIFGERDSGCQAGDGVTNRDGIIKCSERVEADIETEVNHLLSHVVGEAAAENDNLVIQGDSYLASARFDGSL